MSQSLPGNSGKFAYFEGEIVPVEEARVHVMTHALQYGTACFGGMRAYVNQAEDNLFLFRPLDHFRRLADSARILQMEPPHSPTELVEIARDLLRREKTFKNTYLRPFLYKKDLSLSPRLHNVSDGFFIYTLFLDNYLDIESGLTTIVSSWQRIQDTTIPTISKASGGYINSALAKSEALQAGMDEAIFLNSRGNVAEGSAENIFIVRRGEVITPSLDQGILEGIVRRSVIDILRREFQLTVTERPVTRSELYVADEIFFCGTGVQVAWIREVDRRIIGNGQIGPVTRKLQDAFFRIVRGENPEYSDWLVPVYER